MNKKVNLIIGTGVLGAYLSSFLLNKNEKTIDKHILLFNLPEVLRA